MEEVVVYFKVLFLHLSGEADRGLNDYNLDRRLPKYIWCIIAETTS
jgi:hypothetical protein